MQDLKETITAINERIGVEDEFIYTGEFASCTNANASVVLHQTSTADGTLYLTRNGVTSTVTSNVALVVYQALTALK